MRIGRTGVFETKSGKVGLAAVVAVTSGDTLVAKEVNSGTLIRFNYGEFKCFDSCGYNPHAADVVRKATGTTVGSQSMGTGRSYNYGSYDPTPEGEVVTLAEFEFSVVTPARQSQKQIESLTETDVHISPAIMEAMRQVFRQMMHKKRPLPVQKVRLSNKQAKSTNSTKRPARRAAESTTKVETAE